MRDLRVDGSRILLNDEPFYQRQVLDQGYWPDGIYTAPTDAALRADVEWIKRLGFNGVRKHQKIEDPRWLYWCDRLGLTVWEEMPAFATDSPSSRERFRREWQEVIRRDSNHPCIVAWAPFNESFGIRDISTSPSTQAFVSTVVGDTRRLDPSRPVVDNSGWEHVETDIADTHNYEPSGRLFRAAWRKFQADPAEREHAPVLEWRAPGQAVVRAPVCPPAVRARSLRTAVSRSWSASGAASSSRGAETWRPSSDSDAAWSQMKRRSSSDTREMVRAFDADRWARRATAGPSSRTSRTSPTAS